MKKLALLLSALLVAGAAYASQATTAPANTKEPAKSAAMGKTHTVSGFRGWTTIGNPMSPTLTGRFFPIRSQRVPGRSSRYTPQWFCW